MRGKPIRWVGVGQCARRMNADVTSEASDHRALPHANSAPRRGRSAGRGTRGGPGSDARAGRRLERRRPRPGSQPADEPARLGPRAHRRVRGPVAVPRRGRARAAAARPRARLRRRRDTARRPRLARLPARGRGARLHGGGARAVARDPRRLRRRLGRWSSSWCATSTSTTRRCCRPSAWPASCKQTGTDPVRCAPPARTWSRSRPGRSRWAAPADGFAYDNERPRHVVDLPAFEIDRLPVTVGDWIEFMDAEGADEPLHWNGTAPDPRLPVMHVSWDEASAYARFRGKRLPTEAGVGEGRDLWRARDGRRRVGVDEHRVRPLPRLPGASIPRVLGGLLRTGISRPARRVVGDQRAGRQQPLPQLGPAAAAPDLRGVQMRGVIDEPPDGRRARLARRGRASRDGPAAEGDPAEVLLRRARLGAVRADHEAARVLPDALRAAAPEPPRAGDRRADRGGGAGRARLGHGLQDARAPVRDGGPRQAPRRMCRSTARRRSCGTASSCSPICSPVSRCTAWSATSSRTSRRSRPAASDSSRSSAGRSATSTRSSDRCSSSGSRARVTGSCSAPTWSRTAQVIEAAYNDADGVTAAFNRNVLRVLNRELDADFDPHAFEHVAFFDRDNEWIEMRLRARSDHSVAIPGAGLELEFAAGEEIRTEISAKFTPERIARELDAAGFELGAVLHGRHVRAQPRAAAVGCRAHGAERARLHSSPAAPRASAAPIARELVARGARVGDARPRRREGGGARRRARRHDGRVRGRRDRRRRRSRPRSTARSRRSASCGSSSGCAGIGWAEKTVGKQGAGQRSSRSRR